MYAIRASQACDILEKPRRAGTHEPSEKRVRMQLGRIGKTQRRRYRKDGVCVFTATHVSARS
eukprot:4642912-Pleurochrysis_carterae.AAC.1